MDSIHSCVGSTISECDWVCNVTVHSAWVLDRILSGPSDGSSVSVPTYVESGSKSTGKTMGSYAVIGGDHLPVSVPSGDRNRALRPALFSHRHPPRSSITYPTASKICRSDIVIGSSPSGHDLLDSPHNGGKLWSGRSSRCLMRYGRRRWSGVDKTRCRANTTQAAVCSVAEGLSSNPRSRPTCRIAIGLSPGDATLKRARALTDATMYVRMSSERIVRFANMDWVVRRGSGGPGPNYWSDSNSNVWVDNRGYLHLAVRSDGEHWQCAEVTARIPTCYGISRFFTIGRLDLLDPNIVFSPFLYHDDSNELDIEFSRWGARAGDAPNAQYVVQPGAIPGHRHQFNVRLNGTYTTHTIDWRAGEVTFSSVHGHYLEPPSPGYLIRHWRYVGADVPVEETGLHVHLNLWLVHGAAPVSGQATEIVLSGLESPGR